MSDKVNYEAGVDFTPVFTQQRNKRLNARVTESEKEWVDKVAAEMGGTTSDVIRKALRVLKNNMDGDIDVV